MFSYFNEREHGEKKCKSYPGKYVRSWSGLAEHIADTDMYNLLIIFFQFALVKSKVHIECFMTYQSKQPYPHKP